MTACVPIHVHAVKQALAVCCCNSTVAAHDAAVQPLLAQHAAIQFSAVSVVASVLVHSLSLYPECLVEQCSHQCAFSGMACMASYCCAVCIFCYQKVGKHFHCAC